MCWFVCQQSATLQLKAGNCFLWMTIQHRVKRITDKYTLCVFACVCLPAAASAELQYVLPADVAETKFDSLEVSTAVICQQRNPVTPKHTVSVSHWDILLLAITLLDIWATRSWSAQGSIYVTVDAEKHSVASDPLFPVPVELRSSCSSLLHPRARDRTPASVTALQPLTSRDLTHTNTHCECQ